MPEIIPQDDSPLTAHQQSLVDKLSQSEVAEIDNKLLAKVTFQWQKVARVVGYAMQELQGPYAGIPDAYYVQQVRKFVSAGILDSQGYLANMQFSEVRLPQDSSE